MRRQSCYFADGEVEAYDGRVTNPDLTAISSWINTMPTNNTTSTSNQQ